MKVRSGKAVAVLAMLCAAGVVVFFLAFQWGRIREEWYLRQLSSKDEVQREDAARRLSELRVVRAIPRLIDVLRGQEGVSLTRREPEYVFRALEGLAGSRALPFIEDACRDRDPDVRSWGLRRLLHNRVDVLPTLLRLLDDPDPSLVVQVMIELGRMGSAAAPAAPRLQAALRSENNIVRLAAADTLGKIGPEAACAVPSLVTALQDEDEGVRLRVVDALGRIGAPNAVWVEALEARRESERREAKIPGE